MSESEFHAQPSSLSVFKFFDKQLKSMCTNLKNWFEHQEAKPTTSAQFSVSQTGSVKIQMIFVTRPINSKSTWPIKTGGENLFITSCWVREVNVKKNSDDLKPKRVVFTRVQALNSNINRSWGKANQWSEPAVKPEMTSLQWKVIRDELGHHWNKRTMKKGRKEGSRRGKECST